MALGFVSDFFRRSACLEVGDVGWQYDRRRGFGIVGFKGRLKIYRGRGVRDLADGFTRRFGILTAISC
jgi:hypothetical protein